MLAFSCWRFLQQFCFFRMFYLSDHATMIAIGYHSRFTYIDPSFHPPTNESTDQRDRSINHGPSGSSQRLVRRLVLQYERLAQTPASTSCAPKTRRQKRPTSQCSARLSTLLLVCFFFNLVVKTSLTLSAGKNIHQTHCRGSVPTAFPSSLFVFGCSRTLYFVLPVLGLCIVTRVPSLAPVDPCRSGR